MSKHGTDENGWPLVPVDPAAIPQGYEAVRAGFPRAGEVAASLDKSAVSWTLNYAEDISPRLIIRPIPKPIRLPLAIVPSEWWVAKNESGDVWCYGQQPIALRRGWYETNGDVERLPPWIAAQLPQEWHELPWDQSAVQQKEGGDT